MTSLMTSAEYFSPDPNIRDARPHADFLVDPLPSLSSRPDMSLHSAISVHGYTWIDGRQVWYESVLERCCALVGRLNPDVIEIVEQPAPVTYFDDQGIKRPHTFDFRFTRTGGARWLFAVKPKALVAKSGVDRLVELVAEQLPPSVADYVTVFTEEMLSEVDLFNAEAVNLATRDAWPEDDAHVAQIIAKLKGEATIGDLAAKADLGGYGYDAVLRAIDAGKLRLVEYGRLDFDAVVARPAKRRG